MVELLICNQVTSDRYRVWAHNIKNMAGRKKEDMTFLDKNEFFNTLAERCNYINTDLVKEVYYELINLTSQELRRQGAIRYPEFGDFYVKYLKEREMRHVGTGQMIKIPMRKVVKFTPTPKLKKFFANLG